MIRRQVVVPVDPERLWAALTDPDEVAAWLGGRVEWEVSEGAPLRFHGNAGEMRDGRIDVVRPMRHLRFHWWPSGGDRAGAGEEGATEVSYLLEPVVEGTRLTVQERPVRGADLGSPARRQPQALAGRWSAWDTRMVGAWCRLTPHGAERVGA